MKGLFHVFAWLLIIQGLGGLLNTVFGWWRWAHDLLLVNSLPFLDGYEVFAAIVIGVLGVALAAASSSARKAADRT
ncbi:hypothetical protein ABT294_16260 [Nonomuraea sp. NPDC000554]|uniref:hypothetical protein n=1 Tax=Nonomuraea sp. NPDC000554 TaxID=3154259 RepID=UPI00331FE9EA